MTAKPRKVRSDAKLEQLTPAQHEQLLTWLDDENLSYAEVVNRLRQEFGVSVGRTAVVCYYQRHVQPRCYEIQSEAAVVLARMKDGPFDAATVNHARMLAFSALVRREPEIDTAAKLLNLVRRAEQQEIARERLELQRRLVAVRERQVGIRSRRQRPAASVSPTSEADSRPAAPRLPEIPATTVSLSEARSVLEHPAGSACEPLASPSAASQAEAAPATPPSADPAATIPHTAAPTTIALSAASCLAAPLQKRPQNPPLYSPYFALNRAQKASDFSPILEIALHSTKLTETAPHHPSQGVESEATCPIDSAVGEPSTHPEALYSTA